MNRASIARPILLGALTGMRSLAGPAALARARGGSAAKVISLLAGAELVADKLPSTPNRTDRLPLTGRAVFGAIVGGIAAREQHGSAIAGALLGASAAIAAAHLAFYARTRLPLDNVAGGMIEDAVVLAMMQRV